MNLLMEEMIQAAVTQNGGIYQGNQVNSIAPFSFRSAGGAGAYGNIPAGGNTVYYGFLRYHFDGVANGGRVVTQLNGQQLVVFTSQDAKPVLFDSLVADNGDGTMDAPLSFVGFKIEVPGAGVLP